MRLRTCLGMTLFGLGACAQIPDSIRIDVDGGSLELKKKPAAEAPTPVPEPAPSPAPVADAPER